jgi:hypothetical protein
VRLAATDPAFILEPDFGWGFSLPILIITLAAAVAASIWAVKRIGSWTETEVVLSALSVVGIAALFFVVNGMIWSHNAGVEQREWAAGFHSWANGTYEVETTMPLALNLAQTPRDWAEDCETENNCRKFEFLIDGRIRPAELVFVGGDAAIFVDGQELERR